MVDTDDAWIPRRFGGEPDPDALVAFVARIRARPGVGERVRRGRGARLPEGRRVSSAARATRRQALARRVSRCGPRPRVVARDLGSGTRLERRSVRDRARGVRELPARPLRPREHGAGGLEHDAGARARDDGRFDRRADRSAGHARRSAARAAGATVDASGPRRWRSRSRRSPWWRSGRFPSSGSDGGISASERLAGASRARISRLPVGRDERRRCDSSGDVRDHVPALRGLVPRLRQARSVRDLRGARDVDGRADGAADRRPRALVRVRAGEASTPASLIALAGLAWSFVAVYVVVGHYRRGGSLYYGFYDQIGGSPQGVVRTLFTDPGRGARRAVRGPRHRLRHLARVPAPLPLRALAGARRSRASAATREHTLGLPLDDGPALSQRCCDCPVPHRRDGLRDRAAVGLATGACDGRRACVLSYADASCSAPGCGLSARRRSAVVPSSRPIVRRPWPKRSHSYRPMRRSRRRTPPGAICRHASTSTRVPRLGRAEWVVVDRADPWVVARDSPILTDHPERIEALVARLEADPAWRDRLRSVGRRRAAPHGELRPMACAERSP